MKEFNVFYTQVTDHRHIIDADTKASATAKAKAFFKRVGIKTVGKITVEEKINRKK